MVNFNSYISSASLYMHSLYNMMEASTKEVLKTIEKTCKASDVYLINKLGVHAHYVPNILLNRITYVAASALLIIPICYAIKRLAPNALSKKPTPPHDETTKEPLPIVRTASLPGSTEEKPLIEQDTPSPGSTGNKPPVDQDVIAAASTEGEPQVIQDTLAAGARRSELSVVQGISSNESTEREQPVGQDTLAAVSPGVGTHGAQLTDRSDRSSTVRSDRSSKDEEDEEETTLAHEVARPNPKPADTSIFSKLSRIVPSRVKTIFKPSKIKQSPVEKKAHHKSTVVTLEKVDIVIDTCIALLQEKWLDNPEKISQLEGIFRIAGSEKTLGSLIKIVKKSKNLNTKLSKQIEKEHATCHDIAKLMPRAFSKLDSSFLTEENLDEILQIKNGKEDDQALLNNYLNEISAEKRQIIQKLLIFLNKLSKYDATTKMNASNLGVVWGQNFFRFDDPMVGLSKTDEVNEATTFMIENIAEPLPLI